MKINNDTTNSNKKIRLVIAYLVVLAVAGAAFLYVYFTIIKSDASNNSNADSQTMAESDRDQSKNLQDNPDIKDTAPNTDHPAPPTTNETSDKQQVQVVTSTDQSGGTVFIRGGVNYPVTDGTCYAQLIGPSGQSIRKDAAVLPGPASADCKTISIPVNELASGSWKFILHYTSDNYEGASVETSFTI